MSVTQLERPASLQSPRTGTLDESAAIVQTERRSFAPLDDDLRADDDFSPGGGDGWSSRGTSDLNRPPKEILHRDFAARLNSACDNNSYVPALHYGRLVWVKVQLEERFGLKVSNETVRKWFSGEARPRHDKITKLAQLLEVDESWLSTGHEPELSPREQKTRNAMASGAVNVLAGVIQLSGGHPAFPEAGDKRAQKGKIDLYAIIKGAQYGFHVSLAKPGEDEITFVVPVEYEQAFVIGVIPQEGPCFHFVELSSDFIAEKGANRGGAIEVKVSQEEAKRHRIRSFGERL